MESLFITEGTDLKISCITPGKYTVYTGMSIKVHIQFKGDGQNLIKEPFPAANMSKLMK